MPVIPQSVPGIDNKTTLHYVHILQQTGLARMLYSGQRGEITQKSEKVFLANTTFYMRSVTDWDSRNTLKLQQKLTTKDLLCYKKLAIYALLRDNLTGRFNTLLPGSQCNFQEPY